MMDARVWVAALCVACGAGAQQQTIGYDLEPPPAAPSQHATKSSEVPPDVVLRAKGPVRALRLPGRVEVDAAALSRELLEAEAICLGEQHDRAADHYAQLWLLDQLARAADVLGLELGVGLEMFQKPYQPALTAYQVGHIDEQELIRRTEYEERWAFPFDFYRPVLERARQGRLALIALNASRELTRAVARDGIDALDPSQAQALPGMDLNQREHRADFERRMQGHPGAEPGTIDKYYQAQIVWDETMAERAASWLATHAPIRRMVILAGQAHCQRSAIPARIERRGAGSARAILLGTEEPTDELGAQFDYALLVDSGDDSASER